MNVLITQFATSEQSAEAEKNLFQVLGLDIRLLVLQIVAFAILVWILSKFVYPRLISAIDAREKAIADSVAAAGEAEAKAVEAEANIEKLLKDARKEAAEIVETAHKEATSMVGEAETKAKQRAEQIVTDAEKRIEQDVLKARDQLKQETIELVALATETIVKEKVDAKKDASLITAALKEAQ